MIVFALVVVPLVAYVGGYYWLPTQTDFGPPDCEPVVMRFYWHRWQADVFQPAAKVEGWLTGGDAYALWIAVDYEIPLKLKRSSH
jgi:hypothetical protein